MTLGKTLGRYSVVYSYGTWVLLNCYPGICKNDTWKLEPQREIRQLHLKVAGSWIGGVDRTFPNLEALVMDDSKEGLRIVYDLTPLGGLAGTLVHLELRMSSQWMCEDEDPLKPLASLTQLQRLYVYRLRDGYAATVKAFEKLVNLEDLFYWGTNEFWLEDQKGETENNILDLSALSKLRRLTFVEPSFCSLSERSVKSLQALVLPDHLTGNISCISVYYGQWCTPALVSELTARDIQLNTTKPSSKEGWKELERTSGSWYDISDDP